MRSILHGVVVALIAISCSTDSTTEYQLTVSVEPPEAGAIVQSATQASAGESITVSATERENWVFSTWSGDYTGGDNPATIIMDRDKSVKALFDKIEHPLTIEIIGEGEVNQEIIKSKSTNYPYSTIVRLTAIEEEGWYFYGWDGDNDGSESEFDITINGPKNVTAIFKSTSDVSKGVGYLTPNDFNGDRLTIQLNPSTEGVSYLITVPNLSSADWFHRNGYLHDQHIVFDVSATINEQGNPTNLKNLPEVQSFSTSEWLQPEVGNASELETEKTFHVWSQVDQEYVQTEGRLAFVGDVYAFYEDIRNEENFSDSNYSEIDNVLKSYYKDLTELMGEPTDLDGNGEIIVYISKTLSEIRNSGEAYVDGCHMKVTPGGCKERGEFIYFMSLDHFSNSDDNRSFYSKNYFPRNILHETIHILQQSHWYRLDMPSESFSIPAYYSEGQAELMSFITGLRTDAIWSTLRSRFDSQNQLKVNPWFSPYDLGALFNWYMHQTFGKGLSQAIIEAVYSPDKQNFGLTEIATGIPEPLLLSMMYSSMLLDGTELGNEFGLEFTQDDIRSLLEDTSLPKSSVPMDSSIQVERTFTGFAIFKIEHEDPIEIELISTPEKAYVMVIQP